MYFPFLRGRQFELIALRELVEKELIGNKIIPVIEPVKLSSTLTKTLKAYAERNKEIAFIHNPQVGEFEKIKLKDDNEKINQELGKINQNEKIISAYHLCFNIESLIQNEQDVRSIIIIADNSDTLSYYDENFNCVIPRFSFIKDETEFRRGVHGHKILIADRFKKQNRNTDYMLKTDESFSSDHLFYKEEHYSGFSDYSVIGNDYSDSGFAPYAVAIHIVYFDEEDKLRIHHFVSDTNDDISDPAGKFKEALEKLVEWNKEKKLSTYGIKQFEELYKMETYPGLGTVKKLALMHHIQLLNDYLEGKK